MTLAGVLALVAPVVASAQTATLRLHDGIAAYNDVDFVSAAALLNRALDPDARPALTPEERARALAYLGAAEFFRKEHARADAAFRRLILLAPRYRLNPETFPPRVLNEFASVRQTTKAADVAFPNETTFVAGREVVRGTVFVSSPHTISVRLVDDHAAVVRSFYDGSVDDSLAFAWNGLDASGRPVEAAQYHLEVISLAAPGIPLRSLRIPLSVRVMRVDTLPLPPARPPDSLLVPERTGAGPGLAFLIPGTVAGATLMGSGVTGSGSGRGARIVAGGIALAAGLLGYVLHRPGRPIAANIAANDSLRAVWAVTRARQQAFNAARRAIVRMTIHTGTPERVEGH